MHLNLKNIIKTFDKSGNMTVTVKEYPVVECSETYMSTTEYGKKFYKMFSKNNFYCADHPEIYLKGNLDSLTLQKDHAYIIFEVKPCKDENRDKKDPLCASNDEIDKWLEPKKLIVKVINQKGDFSSYESIAIRETENWLPSVPLSLGKFTDSGYRFLKSKFWAVDSWLPFFP